MVSLSLNDIKRGLKLPNYKSNELAEFFGALTGDGYINLNRKYNYIIEIAGNKELDENYLKNYLTELIKNLFNLTPIHLDRKDQNTAYLRIRSKGLFLYLLKNEFKKGRKGCIGIPVWIKNNDKF